MPHDLNKLPASAIPTKYAKSQLSINQRQCHKFEHWLCHLCPLSGILFFVKLLWLPWPFFLPYYSIHLLCKLRNAQAINEHLLLYISLSLLPLNYIHYMLSYFKIWIQLLFWRPWSGILFHKCLASCYHKHETAQEISLSIFNLHSYPIDFSTPHALT